MRTRVLYVDGNDDTRACITQWLELEGFEVLSASTYDGAMGIAQRHQVHLLITDLGVRNGNLSLLLVDIQRWHPAKGIALSCNDRWEETFEAGYSAHVLKPLELRKLSMAIADVLDCGLEATEPDPVSADPDRGELAVAQPALADTPDGYGWGAVLGPAGSASGPPIFLSLR